MKRIKLLFMLTVCAICTNLNGQISTDELPYSFIEENQLLLQKTGQTIESVDIPLPVNIKELEKEDAIDEVNGVPPRFGYPIPVKLETANSGTWTKLDNGDRLWQLAICSPGALSINLLYDKFWLPKGSKFFIYSMDKKRHIGAFTSFNNKGGLDNPEGFATDLVFADKIVLEYYEPAGITESAVISLAYVVHGYRTFSLLDNVVNAFQESCPTQVNINCSEGAN
jgi:hypothetical protein